MSPPSPPSTFELAQALARRKASGVLRVEVAGGSVRLSFIEGRLVWATSDDPRAVLGPALVGAGLLTEAQRAELEENEPVDDDLAAQAGTLAGREAVEAVRREVVRARVRLALSEGEDGRFTETSASLAGLDPALLPDLDLAGLGQQARRREPAPAPGLEPDAPLAQTMHVLLERFHARHVDSWYDLLGERPSASPASLERAAAARVASWQAVAEHPSVDAQLRHRARLMIGAVELARDRLAVPTERDAYDQLVRRGGNPKVGDLIAELEPSPPSSFAPTAEVPSAAEAPAAPRKGLLARIFGGGS